MLSSKCWGIFRSHFHNQQMIFLSRVLRNERLFRMLFACWCFFPSEREQRGNSGKVFFVEVFFLLLAHVKIKTLRCSFLMDHRWKTSFVQDGNCGCCIGMRWVHFSRRSLLQLVMHGRRKIFSRPPPSVYFNFRKNLWAQNLAPHRISSRDHFSANNNLMIVNFT